MGKRKEGKIDEQSKAWFDEVKTLDYKHPNTDEKVRECCTCIILADVEKFLLEVHRGDLHRKLEIHLNFCPECGREMINFKKLVIKKLSEKLAQSVDIPGASEENEEDRGDYLDNIRFTY